MLAIVHPARELGAPASGTEPSGIPQRDVRPYCWPRPTSNVVDVASDFLRRWVTIVTLGEALGFAVPATVGALFFDQSPMVLGAAVVLAGVIEGVLLGSAQWLVLRSELPRLALVRWAGWTVVGVVAAYPLGLVPSVFFESWSHWPVVAQILLFVVVGLCLLATIGTAQWVELRRHVDRAGRWIVGTGAAWAAALTVFGLISTPLWQEGQSVTVRVAIGVFAGLVMAVVMALISGLVMRAILTGPASARGAA